MARDLAEPLDEMDLDRPFACFRYIFQTLGWVYIYSIFIKIWSAIDILSSSSIDLLVILLLVTVALPVRVTVQPLVHPDLPLFPGTTLSGPRLAAVHVGLLAVDHDPDERGLLVLLVAQGGGDTLGTGCTGEPLERNMREVRNHLRRPPLTGFRAVISRGREEGRRTERVVGRIVQVEHGRRERGRLSVGEECV